MAVLRWILFLPASLIGGVLASSLLRMGAFIFPEIIRLLVCGAAGAAGMVYCGLYVAPRRTPAVKWILIVLAALLGLLSALGALLAGQDKLEAAVGISMLLTALALSGIKPEEIAETAQPEN